MFDTVPIDFSIINNGAEIALMVQRNFNDAFVFSDGIVIDDDGELFKMNTGKSLINALIHQGKVLIVSLGLSGPVSEYELSIR